MDENTNVGARLRRAREMRGLTLHDISRLTKLSTSTVKAIEQDEFDRLPGGMFRTAYVRMVAEAVGLDPDELARTYRDRFEGGRLEKPPAPADGRGRARLTIVAVVAAAVLTAVFWPPPADDGREPLPELIPVRAIRAFATPAAVAAAGVTASIELELRLHGPCWVSLVADGERVIYGLMQAGEHVTVAAREAMTLRVGDAGAVEYSVNGVEGQPLGTIGEAATIQFTADGTKSL